MVNGAAVQADQVHGKQFTMEARYESAAASLPGPESIWMSSFVAKKLDILA
jgi:hypothetical protein